jgi:hypothetical protein
MYFGFLTDPGGINQPEIVSKSVVATVYRIAGSSGNGSNNIPFVAQ